MTRSDSSSERSSHRSKHTGRLEWVVVIGVIANIVSWVYLGIKYSYFGAEPVAFYTATVLGLPLLAAGGAFTFGSLYIMLAIEYRRLFANGV